MPLLALATVLGASALHVPAHAQVPGGGGAFERVDTNGDGAIDAAELAVFQERAFERLDADGNGTLSVEEATAIGRRREARTERRLDRIRERRAARAQNVAGLDANGDGTLMRQEYAAGAERLLQRADANGDGRLVRAELRGLFR